MTTNNEDNATTAGDGVVTINLKNGVRKMADLPESVAQQLMVESVGNVSANNRDGRNLGTAAIGALTAGIAARHNEMNAEESRAISGVMATPVAGPTTQQP